MADETGNGIGIESGNTFQFPEFTCMTQMEDHHSIVYFVKLLYLSYLSCVATVHCYVFSTSDLVV